MNLNENLSEDDPSSLLNVSEVNVMALPVPVDRLLLSVKDTLPPATEEEDIEMSEAE